MDDEALAALGVDASVVALRERLDGERAVAFLTALPGLAAEWQARLGLRDARLMPGGVLSAALACRTVGSDEPVVLKLSSASAVSARAEAAALRVWDGRGACRLRWASDDGRVMVLDRILPGSPVVPVTPGGAGSDDADACERAARLLGVLHAAARPVGVPDAVEELAWRFGRAHDLLEGGSHARGLIDHAEIDAAHRAALALDRDARGRVLLHGDFIDKNLLLDARGEWWAIDPRPCIGDPCLDAAFWALAHRPGVAVRERCSAVAALARLDADRVWAWARAFAVSESVLVTSESRALAHHAVAVDERGGG